MYVPVNNKSVFHSYKTDNFHKKTTKILFIKIVLQMLVCLNLMYFQDEIARLFFYHKKTLRSKSINAYMASVRRPLKYLGSINTSSVRQPLNG